MKNKTKSLSKLMLMLALMGAPFFLNGCEDNDADDAMDNVEDSMDDAGNEIQDTVDDAGDEIEDATN